MGEKPAGQAAQRSFAFGHFVLIPERQVLLQHGAPVRIGGRALDILTALVSRSGDLVSKRELFAQVWPNLVVEESNLKVNIAALRRVLGDEPGATQYIATVTGRGYRFIADVQASESPGPLPASMAAERHSHNLPTGTTRIFGRADAIEAIRRELEESRIVSIVGPGGIGKTTVALAVAERELGAFKDGVWLVDLAVLKDPELTPDAIASAIGMAVHSAHMLAPLCAFLHDREMLLVLDNCEHLIDAAASCATRILASAARVKILVTSREPLLVVGEHVRRLPTLGLPAPSSSLAAEEALAFPAIQLFVDRASSRLDSFRLSDADAPTVAEICRRLDGLALAIEFAATRVDAFDVRSLLKQLDDRFRLLVGRRAGPERHRTLTTTLDWSYGLLSANEAAILRAVSVFAGTFDADGASAVSGLASAETADVLAQLAAKSLLATDLDADGVAYHLLETTRAYCLELLRSTDEHQRVRLRHAEHVGKVLARAASEWAQRPAREWGAAYGPVVEDLRGALAWAGRDPANQALRISLIVAGLPLWNHFSLTEECRSHVAQAVDELDAAGLTGTAAEMQLQMSLAGTTLFARGPVPLARNAMQRALDIAVQIGDTDYRLRCLRMIGGYEIFSGEHKAAIRTLETFASVAASEDPDSVTESEAHLSLAKMYMGHLQDARGCLERLYDRDLRDLDDPRFARFLYDRNVDVGNVLSNLQWLTGSPDTAIRTAEATVEMALKINHGLSLSNALAVAACPVFFLSGRFQEAERYVAMLEDQVMRHGIVNWRPMALFYRGALARAQGDDAAAGIDDMERAVAEFRAMNHLSRMPFLLGVLAEALAKCGRFVAAAATIQTALDLAYARGDRWCVPELLRISAFLSATEGQSAKAETLLIESMAVAREIGALSWRLRAANDLAGIWIAGGRADEARNILLPTYSEFTEGFATRDLLVASEFLRSRPHP